MIVPLFNLSQTDVTFSIKLHIPLADLSNSEILIEDGILYFSAPPYYLRFEIPGSVEEDDDNFNFNTDNGDMNITMTKSVTGEYFEDLDMLSKFIVNTKSAKTEISTGIQEIDAVVELEKDSVYDWFIPFAFDLNQSDSSDIESTPLLFSCCYGFADSKHSMFTDKPEICLPIDLPYPDHCSKGKRHSLQLQSVQEKFNPEHYIADFCEPDASLGALKTSPPWKNNENRPDFTSDHYYRLNMLANHKLPLLPLLSIDADDEVSNEKREVGERRFIYLGLVDILCAYVHDRCVREDDENSESAWMIVKVAASLSWFETFSNLPDLIKCFYERSLTFPLVRSWQLCQKIRQDVADLLQHKHAKAWILYCLLEIRQMFVEYSGFYIFVTLFLDDYICWLQKSASAFVLKDLGTNLASYKFKKEDVNLPLKELEQLSSEILETEKLVNGLHDVKLTL